MDNAGHGFHGDRPQVPGAADHYGFRPAAEAFAAALVDPSTARGFVFGIEGPWGSGKTTLLNLTRDALEARKGESRPVIVPFSPCLVREREALITEFFGNLATVLQEPEDIKGEVKRIVGTLADYAFRVGPPVASAAAAFGIPGTSVAVPLLKAVKDARAGLLPQRSLSKLKDCLTDDLRQLSRRIVVFIDDVDRLDPGEVMEILRLVRAVADFPNVVYVLAYDRNNVARAVRRAIRMDGYAYLEKIVQATVPVPAPEAFDLRRMFATGLATFAQPTSDEEEKRLEGVISQWGGDYLRTPRDVNRTLDALRLVWPSLRGKVDLADLVWLHLVKVTAPRLYDWARDYAMAWGAAMPGMAMVSREDVTRLRQQLAKAFGRDITSRDSHGLREVFPGILNASQDADQQGALFAHVDRPDLSRLIRDRRLASPDHWRLYFALTEPSGAPTAADYRALAAAAAEGKDAVTGLLRRWMNEGALETGVKGLRLLERLADRDGLLLDPAWCRSMLLALADILDEPVFHAGRSVAGLTAWGPARKLLPRLRAGMNDPSGETRRAFEKGNALGWLMDVVRHETFAQGRFGDRQEPEDLWIFGHEEFDRIIEIMHARLMAVQPADLLAVPAPVSLLYGWEQTGGGHAARAKIAEAVASDEGLVKTIEILFPSMNAPFPERRNDIARFLDVKTAKIRLERISSAGGDLAVRAREVLGWLSSAEGPDGSS